MARGKETGARNHRKRRTSVTPACCWYCSTSGQANACVGQAAAASFPTVDCGERNRWCRKATGTRHPRHHRHFRHGPLNASGTPLACRPPSPTPGAPTRQPAGPPLPVPDRSATFAGYVAHLRPSSLFRFPRSIPTGPPQHPPSSSASGLPSGSAPPA